MNYAALGAATPALTVKIECPHPSGWDGYTKMLDQQIRQ